MAVALASQNITVEFGTKATEVTEFEGGWKLAVAMPVLGSGASAMELFQGDTRRRERGYQLVDGDGIVAGAMVWRGVAERLEWPVYEAYRDLFRIIGKGRSLYRVWNYVPRINVETSGLENYRHFNIGRHRAFEEFYGPAFSGRIPAASALGVDEDCFAIAFVAGVRVPDPVENPDQVPAYRYPGEYGPKSPAFARGSVASIAGRRTGFLSGTSSVKGHLTVGGGDFDEQFRVTLDNIRLVAQSMGFGDAMGPNPGIESEFRFFVRNGEDAGRARRLFEALPGAERRKVIYLRSDICRADLSLEIEAVFRAAAGE